MAEILSLSRARKAKARAEAEAEAAENRTKFGRTKAEKLADRQTADDARRRLEGHRLDTPRPDQTDPASRDAGTT